MCKTKQKKGLVMKYSNSGAENGIIFSKTVMFIMQNGKHKMLVKTEFCFSSVGKQSSP